jgi:phosphoribosyl-ATP pyrophosphohydrolase
MTDKLTDEQIAANLLEWADSIDGEGDDLRPLLRLAAEALTDRLAQIKSAVDGAAKFADRAATLTARVAELTRERDEARAYLKAFVYATIDPNDKRADAQLHKANPAMGWLFVMDDTKAGDRQILSSQVRRAMEIVGYDKLKIEPPGTTVADDLVEANRAKRALAARVAELEGALDAARASTRAALTAALPLIRAGVDERHGFGVLVASAYAEADKAMRKFPQPNYVISKVAEEAGEVVKAAIHCAENRETADNVAGEMKQLIAMLYRLWVEGDQVHGLPPVAVIRALKGCEA